MAFVALNPRYREPLARLGLRTPGDFLGLAGVIYCGHPDRHVLRVAFGEEVGGAFLKREHRVPWRDRLANAWAGRGFVAKAYREFLTLREVAAAGIGCPEPIAAGEDGAGRAFLLLRELPGCSDLRTFLRDRASGERCGLATCLGVEVARIHAAGFDHPDLYSKHVLIAAGADGTPAFHFLDWQRSRRRRRVSWAVRLRDLAALDATLAADLVAVRDRLACLRAYLRHSAATGAADTPSLAEAVRTVRKRATALLRKRRIRELRRPPLESGRQNLVWLDGEALCVTREFRDELNGRVPEWLVLPGPSRRGGALVWHCVVSRAENRLARLVRRSGSRPLAWFWAWLRRRPLTSPELEQAATLFRLERYGVVTPRLLAVGQKTSRPGRTESLLLTEPVRGAVPFAAWLARTADRATRREVLAQAGAVLRRVHDAGHVFISESSAGDALHVRPARTARVVLGCVSGLRKMRRFRPADALRDLAALQRELGLTCSRSERLRLLLAYFGLPRLTPALQRLARKLLKPPRQEPCGTAPAAPAAWDWRRRARSTAR